jgi:methylated-DNA-protein-cysteine methyltransferase-like protein
VASASTELEPKDSHVRILDVIRRIPLGCVSTYGAVAEAAGLPGRARLVGYVLRACPLSDGVPWHRVINASGRISLRRGSDASEQRRRLIREGVEIDAMGRIDLSMYMAGVDAIVMGDA